MSSTWDYDRYDLIGEPKWDFASPVEVPFPDIFPYNIDDADCLVTLSRNYLYGVEVRMESTIFPPLGNHSACTWREVGEVLNRPVLPARSFREAFGNMSEEEFESEVVSKVSWPFDTNLTLFWYPLRAELGKPQYCVYEPEGYEMGECVEWSLNRRTFVSGPLVEETRDEAEGVIMANAVWHSDSWLLFLNPCNSRAVVVLNGRDQVNRIFSNNDIEATLLWVPKVD